jgi:hypothetical protein
MFNIRNRCSSASKTQSTDWLITSYPIHLYVESTRR